MGILYLISVIGTIGNITVLQPFFVENHQKTISPDIRRPPE